MIALGPNNCCRCSRPLQDRKAFRMWICKLCGLFMVSPRSVQRIDHDAFVEAMEYTRDGRGRIKGGLDPEERDAPGGPLTSAEPEGAGAVLPPLARPTPTIRR